MARPLRLELPGGWYHVTARGNGQKVIFRQDRDRLHFRELLAEAVERFAIRLHSYVLMDNHYHLLLQLSDTNLSQAMQWLGVSHAVWFNRRHGRVGHLFQGRFKGILVEEARVREVSRYVHLNPVRLKGLGLDKAAQRAERRGAGGQPDVGQVRERLRRLCEYRWSSYRAYVGADPCPAWLTTRVVLAMGDPGTALAQRRAYRRYVEEAVRAGWTESPWERLEAQVVLGGAEFVARLRARLGAGGDPREQPSLRVLRGRPAWEQVVRAVEAVKKECWSAFRDRYGDWGRDLALYVGRRCCGMGLKALAVAAGGLDYGSLATALQRFRRRLERDPHLRTIHDRIKGQLSK